MLLDFYKTYLKLLNHTVLFVVYSNIRSIIVDYIGNIPDFPLKYTWKIKKRGADYLPAPQWPKMRVFATVTRAET